MKKISICPSCQRSITVENWSEKLEDYLVDMGWKGKWSGKFIHGFCLWQVINKQ